MALKVGDAAPDFKLKAAIGEKQGEFQLSQHRGKAVVLLFYALDFTPVCQNELPEFQQRAADFAAANAELVGINTDTVFSHIAFQKEVGGISYPIVADRWPYAEVAKSYGIFPPTTHPVAYSNERAIFVVDKDGKIAWSKVYELGQLPDAQEVLEVVRKLASNSAAAAS
ncbi:MAG: redoxin domain-containing protein [Terriglobia bacterium]